MYYLSRAIVFIACLAFLAFVITPTFGSGLGVFTVALIFTWPLKGIK